MQIKGMHSLCNAEYLNIFYKKICRIYRNRIWASDRG